jgi:methyl-accepting chemotaxis protein
MSTSRFSATSPAATQPRKSDFTLKRPRPIYGVRVTFAAGGVRLMVSERRRRVIVDLQFQVRQVVPVLVAASAGVVAGAATVSVPLTHRPAGPEAAAWPVIYWPAGAAAVLVMAAVSYLQLVRSNRLAGPALRLCRSLRRLGDGDLAVQARLREGDELQELSAAITDASAGLREKVLEAQSAARALRRLVFATAETATYSEEVAAAVQRLEAALHQFRTMPEPPNASGGGPLRALRHVEFGAPVHHFGGRTRRRRLPLPASA